MQEGWVVVVTECGSGFDRSVEVEDNLDWYAVAMAGEAAMAGSSNGSAQVTLLKDEKLVETLYPKGRDSERRAWGMASVITQLKHEVDQLESLEAATTATSTGVK